MIQDQDYLWKLEENDFWHKNKDRILIKLVKPGKVLDIGAGTGSFTLKLAKLGMDVTYIDASKKYYTIAKKRAKNENLRLGFINGYFPSKKIKGKFDNIIISGFIEHIEDDRKLLTDIYKLLNNGGRMILLTSAYPSLYSNFDRNVGHYRRYSKIGLRTKMQMAGFNVKFLKYWDILGMPVLFITKLTGNVPISTDKLNNRILNYLLDRWFIIFENKMLLPFGLDLIAMAEK